MLFNLSDQHSVANQFLLELRDKSIQQDRMRFRKNVERLGEIMAYEVSKKLPFTTREIETPLGRSRISVLQQQPVLITILRAGLPYFQGFLNFFDRADSGFVGAYREESTGELSIKLDYVASPDLERTRDHLYRPHAGNRSLGVRLVAGSAAKRHTFAYTHCFAYRCCRGHCLSAATSFGAAYIVDLYGRPGVESAVLYSARAGRCG